MSQLRNEGFNQPNDYNLREQFIDKNIELNAPDYFKKIIATPISLTEKMYNDNVLNVQRKFIDLTNNAQSLHATKKFPTDEYLQN